MHTLWGINMNIIDKRELLEYDFIRQNFTVPMEKWHLVYNTFHTMGEKEIFLNNLTLDAIYHIDYDFEKTLGNINVLYNSLDNQMDTKYDFLYICSLIQKIKQRVERDRTKLEDDLDDAFNLLNKIDELRVYSDSKLRQLYLLVSYYWIKRKEISVDEMFAFIQKFVDNNYFEILVNDGFIKDGAVAADINGSIAYIDNLYNREHEAIR